MFEQMTTFVRIAEAGASRAARSLGLSLPSRHLRWLEKELGTALAHRTTRQLHLTGAGHEFATRARALLLGLDDAKQALRPAPSLTGRVVVTAPSALGTQQLSSIMPALAVQHPRLPVELRLEDRAVDLVWSFETPEGPKSISVDGPLFSNNVLIIRDAILAGVGAGWLPDYVIGEELREGRLVRLLPEAKLPAMSGKSGRPSSSRSSRVG